MKTFKNFLLEYGGRNKDLVAYSPLEDIPQKYLEIVNHLKEKTNTIIK
jgi:hypothetical protein